MQSNRTSIRFCILSTIMVPVLILPVVSRAQSDTSAPPGSSQTNSGAQASAADKHFVQAALKGGMAEVKLGQLASQKGNSDDVKQFGQKMVEDHTKLGDQMKEVENQIGVTPPAMLSPTDKALESKLEALSGDQFDKAYIRAMVKDPEKDLEDFQKEASTGTSATVKDAAAHGKQVIAAHLDMIQKIAQAHNVTTQSKNTSGAR
jgi:putative membrane protein